MRHFNYYLIGALMLSGLLLPAPAAGQSLETPPAPAKPKDFTLPQTHTFELDNGFTVTLIPYGQVPKTTLYLHFAAGNEDDGDKFGLSDIVFELLQQGTSSLTAAQIAEQAAAMGGQVQTSVSMNSSFVAMDVLSDYGVEAVSLLAELIRNSQFEQSQLIKAIQHRWRETEVAQSQAQGQAAAAFYRTMYGDHVYGNFYPTKSQLTSIQRQDVLAFAQENLVARRAHLYVAGMFDETRLKAAITQAFAQLDSGTPSTPVQLPDDSYSAKLVQIDRALAPQSTVRLGQPTIAKDHDDYIAMEVMNTLLGGMFSSRITTNIREDKGYTYSPRSVVFSYKDASVWYEAADIQGESTAEALNEITDEIARLQETYPPAEELEGVKNYMAGIFVLQNSSRIGLIRKLAELETHDLPRSRLTDYISQVRNVTAPQISEVASRYLDLDKMSLIVVGDQMQLNEELPNVTQLPIIKQQGE